MLAYRRRLREGWRFIGTSDPMVSLERSTDELARQFGGEPVRLWVALRFYALGSGRPFVAFGELERPGGVAIHFRRDDDPLAEIAPLGAIARRRSFALLGEISDRDALVSAPSPSATSDVPTKPAARPRRLFQSLDVG